MIKEKIYPGEAAGKTRTDNNAAVWIPRAVHQNLLAGLQKYFGLLAFRPFQEEVIVRTLQGVSQLAVMPTGSGKSLCYQLPAMMLPQPVIVLSPLIALMHDQVKSLTQKGIAAAALTSHNSWDVQQNILRQFQQGRLRLLYLTPERLQQSALIHAVKQRPPGLIVVDEAHCISEWGHDFRPAYRRIHQFIREMGRPPVLALTATATARVRQ
ncbi:MAG: DEAD/DEAH box helicase, partial [Firmicutes bacterium]|nr:DEAD/DEAH box helicase [Bacillota bacterium]